MLVDPRIAELVELAATEGIRLPYPAAVIVGLEDKGFYVDLQTGMMGSADERVQLTVVGEAAAVADRAWWDD
jgi:hypothetical protein